LEGNDLARKPIIIPELKYELIYVSSKKILLKLTDLSNWGLDKKYKIKILTHNIYDEKYHEMDKIIVVEIFNHLPFEKFEEYIDNSSALKNDYKEASESLRKYYFDFSLLQQILNSFRNKNYENLLINVFSKISIDESFKLSIQKINNYIKMEELIIENKKNNDEAFEIIKKVNHIRINLKSNNYDELGFLEYLKNDTHLSIEKFKKSNSILSMFSLGKNLIFIKGFLYFELKDYENAKKMYLKAIDNGYIDAMSNLGKIIYL
jgi:tetratricopeptide (TPR) repeat protein